VICLALRVPGESVGPRPLSGVVVRPLNFTVRRHVIFGSVATLSTHHTLGCRCPWGSAGRDRPRCVGQLLFGDTYTRCVPIRCSRCQWSSIYRHGRTAGIFSLPPLREPLFSTVLVDNSQRRAQLRPLWPAALS
jgi:hypothetical protein